MGDCNVSGIGGIGDISSALPELARTFCREEDFDIREMRTIDS